MERVKVTKVKKTEETFTPQGTDKTLHKSLVALEDGRKGWTFSEKILPGEMELEIESSKANIDGTWYDYKFKLPKKDFPLPTGYRGKSPEDQKSIIRQHSQEMALRRIEIEANLGLLDKDSYNESLIAAYTNMFERDATGEAATPAPFPSLTRANSDEAPLVPPPGLDDEINLDDVPF